jgi:hypothetical protein
MPKINKRENELKGAYWQRFDVLTKPGTFFRMNVQDVRTSGYADSQLLGNKIASFWEFKHATPNFKNIRSAGNHRTDGGPAHILPIRAVRGI